MKKKLIITIVAVALVLTMTVGITLAYLTDRDSDVNVMTVGKVTVSMDLQERNDAGELDDFTQKKELRPLVEQTVGDKKGLAAKDSLGLPDLDAANNFIDKVVTIDNTGKNDAYIRVLVAVPEVLVNADNDTTKDIIKIVDGTGVKATSSDTAPAYSWTMTKAPNVMTINEVPHVVYVYTANDAVTKDNTLKTSGAALSKVLAGVYLNSWVDYLDDTNEWILRSGANADYTVIDWDFDNGVEIPVYTQAVQADGFLNATDAFNIAYGDTVSNDGVITNIVNPWDGTVYVSDAAGLTEALKSTDASTHVVLTNDIELTADVNINKDVVIDGNGFTISSKNGNKLLLATDSVVVVKEATFTSVTVETPANTPFSGTYAMSYCTFTNKTVNNWKVIQTGEGAEIYAPTELNTFAGS